MSNNESKFQLEIEIQTQIPYKKDEKHDLITMLINEFESHGGKDVSLDDSYYIDRRSVEALQTFVLIIDAIASSMTIIQFCVWLKNQLKKNKNKGSIIVKRKNG